MDPKLADEVEQFAKARVADVNVATSYDDLKMALIHAELMLGDGERQDQPGDENYDGFIQALDSIWGRVCEAAIKKALSLAEDDSSFAALLKTPVEEIQSALWDNYLWGAMAAVIAAQKNPSIKRLPLLAEAAFNKHSYPGYKDEIACLRMLLWAGFDVNAQDENGMTALHYMASLKNHPYSHPRAVRLLLMAGAMPDIQNARGDTALCYLSGNTTWSSALNNTAWMLISVGANPNCPSSDGATAKSLLIASNSVSPNDDRQELIEELA